MPNGNAGKSTLIPALRYRDAHAAIAWLEKAFGFTRHAVYENSAGMVEHAELVFRGGMLMLGSVREDTASAATMIQPDECGGRSTGSLYLVVPDAAAAYECAKTAGAEITMDLQEMSYGGKAFNCLDLERHSWGVGEYDPWAEPA